MFLKAQEAWITPLCNDKVCHSAEVAYEFDVSSLLNYDYTEKEKDLSTHMLTLWSNFAKYGNPNGNVQVSYCHKVLNICVQRMDASVCS